LEALLSTISKNVEHWKLLNAKSVHQKVYFLLNSWLEGIRPPPRCQALMNDAQCLEEAAVPEGIGLIQAKGARLRVGGGQGNHEPGRNW